MDKKSWMVIEDDSDTRVMECRCDKDKELLTYDDAKEQALNSLEDHVRPYLKRINELRQDDFKERGKLPKYKAWRSDSRWSSGRLVAAGSQRRAAELLHTNTYEIRSYYSQAGGDWWYQYADEESVWLERVKGTGEYVRVLAEEEAEQIIQAELARFETMPLTHLTSMIGQEGVAERVCSHGLPVAVKWEVRRYDWSSSEFHVVCSIYDRVVRGCQCSLEREIQTVEPVTNWQKEGF